MRVTLVRGRFLVVDVDDSSSSPSEDSVLVCGGILETEVDDSDVPEVDDGIGGPGASVGPISEVTGGLVLVIVGVVVVVEVFDVVDAYVGGTNSIGACSGLSAELVSATTAHTSRAIAARATTLAPTTAGVE
ncbi:hypothetical protein ACWDTP_11325 [Mycobacterium sp. NPDC003449]